MAKNYSVRVRQTGMKGPGKPLYLLATKEDAEKSVIYLNGQNDGNTYFWTEIDAVQVLTVDQVMALDKAERAHQQVLKNFATGTVPASLVQTASPVTVS